MKNFYPNIYTFGHKGPSVVNVICDLVVVIFENLGFTYSLDVDVRVKYIECIL